jgi:hypothetical protein
MSFRGERHRYRRPRCVYWARSLPGARPADVGGLAYTSLRQRCRPGARTTLGAGQGRAVRRDDPTRGSRGASAVKSPDLGENEIPSLFAAMERYRP